MFIALRSTAQSTRNVQQCITLYIMHRDVTHSMSITCECMSEFKGFPGSTPTPMNPFLL